MYHLRNIFSFSVNRLRGYMSTIVMLCYRAITTNAVQVLRVFLHESIKRMNNNRPTSLCRMNKRF